MVKDWKTVRVVVEVRTNDEMTEQWLANRLSLMQKEIEQRLGKHLKSRVRFKAFKRTVGALSRTDR